MERHMKPVHVRSIVYAARENGRPYRKGFLIMVCISYQTESQRYAA